MRRTGVVLVLAATLVALMASPAFAHATLEGTDPPAGAVLRTAPKQVTLRYDQSVGVSLGSVRVFDQSGARVEIGSPHHPGGADDVVRVDLPHLSAGSYVVTWRVISADTHPVQGAFTFQLGANTAVGSRQLQGLAGRLLSNQGGSTTVGVVYGIDRLLVFAALALLIGGAGLLVFVWPQGRASRRARRLVWAGWIALTGATAVGIGLEGAYGAALPLVDALRPDIINEVLGTRFGEVSVLRLALLVVAFPLLRLLLPRRATATTTPLPAWWKPASAATAIGLASTPGLAGHATTGVWVAGAVPADAVHVGAMSLWLGGLAVLGVALLPRGNLAEIRAAVPRFSGLAMICVATIVATGIFQAWRQLGTFDALRSTDYGNLLLVKIALVVVVLLVAATSRNIVLRAFRHRRVAVDADRLVAVAPGGGSRIGAVATDEDVEDGEDTEYADYERDESRQLRGRVIVEVVVAIIILAVTSLLVNARPARSIVEGPSDVILKSHGLWLDVLAVPGRAGPNDVHVYLQSPGGAPTAVPPIGGLSSVQEFELKIDLPNRDIAPITVPLRRAGAGHYLAYGFNIPINGSWRIDATAFRNRTEAVTFVGTLTVR